MNIRYVLITVELQSFTARLTTLETSYSEQFETSSCSASLSDLLCEFGRRKWIPAGSGQITLEANPDPGFGGGFQLVLAGGKQVTLETPISTKEFQYVEIEIKVKANSIFGSDSCVASYRVGGGVFDEISNIVTATKNEIFPTVKNFAETNTALDDEPNIRVLLEQT